MTQQADIEADIPTEAETETQTEAQAEAIGNQRLSVPRESEDSKTIQRDIVAEERERQLSQAIKRVETRRASRASIAGNAADAVLIVVAQSEAARAVGQDREGSAKRLQQRQERNIVVEERERQLSEVMKRVETRRASRASLQVVGAAEARAQPTLSAATTADTAADSLKDETDGLAQAPTADDGDFVAADEDDIVDDDVGELSLS